MSDGGPEEAAETDAPLSVPPQPHRPGLRLGRLKQGRSVSGEIMQSDAGNTNKLAMSPVQHGGHWPCTRFRRAEAPPCVPSPDVRGAPRCAGAVLVGMRHAALVLACPHPIRGWRVEG